MSYQADSPEKSSIRSFESGATRDSEEGKFDFEGFLAPCVLYRFAAYMDKHRMQANGELRDSDNWQKGIPTDAYMKSMWRHFFDVWDWHRTRKQEGMENEGYDELEESLCALMFNVMGYLFNLEMGIK